MSKVSIIIPVYNTEQYLSRCIESVLHQSYSDFELLLIDDGSNDSSGAVCDAYADKDSRVRVFHKENGGVSSARNMGLDNAIGEWVCFVDSDDELYQDGLRVLVEGISNQVELVMAGYDVFDSKWERSYSIDIRQNKIIAVAGALMELYKPQDYAFQGYVWGKLYKLSVIQDQHLRFAEDLIFTEDRLFVTQYICSIHSKVFYTTAPVYMYFERQGSTMGTLKETFNIAVITDLDARIRMKQVIGSRFEDKELAGLIDYDIYRGYRKIVGFMQAFHYKGKRMKRRLRRKCIGAVGLKVFLSFDSVRNKRRIKNKIKGLFGKTR